MRIRLRFYCFAAATIGIALLGGCRKQPEQVREWKASDHGQPAEAQLDPSRRPDEKGPESMLSAEERAARALWAVSCASCHGRGGRGDGPGKPPGANVADLTNPAWQKSRTDEQIAEVIIKGRGMMPAFAEQIGKAGVVALVKLVRSMDQARANVAK